ncbi:MAG: hypothetical protein ACQCN6_00685 [Candidatus Bathyarchaeia archaeon]|jgi:uncharacterized protein YyaL (SSP411 family)
MDKLSKTINWYLTSPIQQANGAYLAYYSPFKKGPIYPEITAYAITVSTILYNRQKDNRFLEKARASAAYMNSITQDGAVPSFSDDIFYAFDTGIYISGLLDLFSVTKEEQYIENAKESLNWLQHLWEKQPYSASNVVPEKPVWYHRSAIHLVKLAIPFIKASICFKDKTYEDKAVKLLDKYKKLQTEHGSFLVEEGSDIIMAHPHSYATEAYLYAYSMLKNEEYYKIAKKACDWLSLIQNPDGSIYRSYTENNDIRETLRTSDATAQSTRLWKLMGQNENKIEIAYQYLDGISKDGGLRLIKSNSLTNTILPPHGPIYSWPTFFYLHSLSIPFGDPTYCKEIF